MFSSLSMWSSRFWYLSQSSPHAMCCIENTTHMSDNIMAILSCWPQPLTPWGTDCCPAQSQLLKCSVHCLLGWMPWIFQHIQNTLANQQSALVPFVFILPTSFHVVRETRDMEVLFWSKPCCSAVGAKWWGFSCLFYN